MSAVTFDLANLTDPEDRAPLYCQYAGQMQPQGAHVYLSQHGEVSADYRADVGNACRSADEWHHVTLSWSVSPYAKGEILAALLQDKALPLLEAIHAGHSVEWDGYNRRGKLNAHAEAASDALAELLEETFEGDTSNPRQRLGHGRMAVLFQQPAQPLERATAGRSRGRTGSRNRARGGRQRGERRRDDGATRSRRA